MIIRTLNNSMQAVSRALTGPARESIKDEIDKREIAETVQNLLKKTLIRAKEN